MTAWFEGTRQDEQTPNEPTSRDRPLSFHWFIPADESARLLNLSPAPDPRLASARSRIIAEALLADEEGQWVSYSRRKQFYAGRRRYNGNAFTFNNVLGTVEEFKRLDLIEEERAEPGQLGWQSRFRASRKLVEALGHLDLRYQLTGLIRLKDTDGALIDFRETDLTWRLSRELQAINADLASIQLELPGSDIIRLRHHIVFNGVYYRPVASSLHRVFNRSSFHKGGRAFGWWQNLPKLLRRRFLMDREPVVEPDFTQLHPSMLYALRGCSLIGDAYETGEFSREHGKLAFNVAVNTRTRQGTISALANKADWTLSRRDTAKLLEMLERRNAPIAEDLHADRGIVLMNLDSQIIMRATRACLAGGIAVLPVHDSMLTPSRYEGRVAEIMEESAEFVLKRLKPCRVSVSSVLVPQMLWEVGPSVPPSSSSSSRSPPVQLDLFPGSQSCKSLSIQLRELRHSLGLSQASLASRLGCSRPHVANVENGRHRFGEWPRHRLRELVHEVGSQRG